MWQTLVKKAHQFLSQLSRWLPHPDPDAPRPRRPLPSLSAHYAPLQRVLLTDEVGRTLFEEYQEHRSQAHGDDETAAQADVVLPVPATHELFSPAVDVVALQLFAYAIAKARGCDVDQPRNLAKTVTVE